MFEIFIAALAGLLSFLSPCVLPLVPAYISYMAGRVTHTVSAEVGVSGDGTAVYQQTSASRLAMGLHALAFVGGFTVVFVTFGVAASALVFVLEDLLIRLGGMLIILFGLHFMGAIPAFFQYLRKNQTLLKSPLMTVAVGLALSAALLWGFTGTLAVWLYDGPQWTLILGGLLTATVWLTLFLGDAFTQPGVFWNKTLNTLDVAFYADTRREMNAEGHQGLLGSFSMGLVFSAGWTPCVGPVLGAAMGLAAVDATIADGAIRMAAFSLGLGIPFIITALMMDSARGQLRKLNKHLNKIKLVTGALLVFVGVMMVTGELTRLSAQLNDTFGEISIRLEECVVGTVRDEIGLGSVGTCLNDSVPFEILKAEYTGTALSAPQIRFYARQYPELDLAAHLDPAAVESALADEQDADLPLVTSGADAVTAPVDADDATEAVPVGLSVGNRAPDFQTTTPDGQPVALSDYRGQVVLLNFWYTTCPPCEIEMPEFQAAFEEYQDDGLVILAVNREEGPEAIQTFAAENGLTFPLALDESGDIQQQFGVRTYPTSFLIDQQGIIRNVNFSILTVAQIEQWIIDALA